MNLPSLPEHPNHGLYRKYYPNGGGSIFTFEVKGNAEDAQKFIRITIQVRDRGHLMHVMRTIRQNANVEQVKRVFEAGIPSDRRRQARR